MDADEKINNLDELMKGIRGAKPRLAAISEIELAELFVETITSDWRYVADEWKCWFSWSGNRWEAEKTLLVQDKARLFCRATPGASKKLKTVYAIENLARAYRCLSATIAQWDSEISLVNTPKGTIDTKSGALHEPSRKDYCTKLTGAAPGQRCDRWLLFLQEIFDSNEELISYMQKVFGYCLTGSTEEHALWFFYGTGSNGKSVLLSTIAGILGDYATTAPIETFTASNHHEHPTELAALRGARLVTANETEEGRRWAEAKIKQLTGGDEIAARYMRQNYFNFKPQFKLIVAGNHKPSLRTVDEAIRRRFHLIPFSVTIPNERRNPRLAEELRMEWPGILRWMVEGCLKWQSEGLTAPKSVIDATSAYLADEDAIAQWIEDRCTPRPSARSTRGELYKSWKEWADLNGEIPGSQKQFVQKMTARGFPEYRSSSARGFQGIEVN